MKIRDMKFGKKFKGGVSPYVWIIFVVVLIVLGIVSFYFTTRETCGNGICDKGENCFNCIKDCACKSGEICSEKEKECVPKVFCGDGTCNPGENCFDCPRDCTCEENEYCSYKTKGCVKPVCGNGICETLESPENCCDDCKCTIAGEVCNEETHKCETVEFLISDERAKELVENYLSNGGMEITSMELSGLREWNKELVKVVRVKIVGEEWIRTFGVTENEEVIELPVP